VGRKRGKVPICAKSYGWGGGVTLRIYRGEGLKGLISGGKTSVGKKHLGGNGEVRAKSQCGGPKKTGGEGEGGRGGRDYGERALGTIALRVLS